MTSVESGTNFYMGSVATAVLCLHIKPTLDWEQQGPCEASEPFQVDVLESRSKHADRGPLQLTCADVEAGPRMYRDHAYCLVAKVLHLLGWISELVCARWTLAKEKEHSKL